MDIKKIRTGIIGAVVLAGVVGVGAVAFGPLVGLQAVPAKVSTITEPRGFADVPTATPTPTPEPTVAPVVAPEPAPVVEAPAPVVEEPVYVEPAPVEEVSSGLLPAGAVPPQSADGPFPDSSFCESQALTWDGTQSVCG